MMKLSSKMSSDSQIKSSKTQKTIPKDEIEANPEQKLMHQTTEAAKIKMDDFKTTTDGAITKVESVKNKVKGLFKSGP